MDGPLAPYVPEAGTVTVFTTSWCGFCRRLKYQLDRAKVAYREVDIDEHPEAAAVVAGINNGNHTVPTVVFPDGSTATNPSGWDVSARLAE